MINRSSYTYLLMEYLLEQNVAILVTCVTIVTGTGYFEYGEQ